MQRPKIIRQSAEGDPPKPWTEVATTLGKIVGSAVFVGAVGFWATGGEQSPTGAEAATGVAAFVIMTGSIAIAFTDRRSRHDETLTDPGNYVFETSAEDEGWTLEDGKEVLFIQDPSADSE